MISNRVKKLNPYVPGEQPKDRDYIKLNANENPYPPSEFVQKSMLKFVDKNFAKLAVYPDPDSNELTSAIAKMLNKTGGVLCRCNKSDNDCVCDEKDKIPFEITPDMIFAGNGSDEVLSFVFYSFFDSDVKLVLPSFTYSFYPVYAGFYNIELEKIPLKQDWSLDTDLMLKKANENNSSIIFANPNAPTGIALSRDEVRQMLLKAPKDKVFVVDEAYADFGDESCIPLLSEFKNLVIVRTFSKSMCGAGMRIGYIVANPELIQTVVTVKNSFNHFPIDAINQVAGTAACEDALYYSDCAKKVVEERESFEQFLLNLGWNVIPSKTNFVFVQHPSLNGEVVYQKIKQEGILVRHFNTPGIENFVRISIGTKEQMDKLKQTIKLI